jgi:polysaccharide export outer membrane protein
VDSLAVEMAADMEPVIIAPGDQLAITISSLNKEEDLFFNNAAAPVQKFGEQGSFLAYTVDKDGYILIHKIGQIKAAGSSRNQLSEALQDALRPYLKDPIATVSFLNHKVTLLGDVANPKLINLADDRISLPDVLAMGGDLTINGRRDQILVVRESGSKKLIKKLTLEDGSVFSSPWYWLRNNDIVYVSGDDDRRMREERRNRFSVYYSMTISALSLLIIIVDRILN